jgi:predicted TIM-barrel fold metal-dependent hydrolase
VIFGSDWPHMEGMQHPREIFDELDDISLPDQQKILRDNTVGLNQRQRA